MKIFNDFYSFSDSFMTCFQLLCGFMGINMMKIIVIVVGILMMIIVDDLMRIGDALMMIIVSYLKLKMSQQVIVYLIILTNFYDDFDFYFYD